MAEYQVSQIYVRILLLLMEQDTNVSVPAGAACYYKGQNKGRFRGVTSYCN